VSAPGRAVAALVLALLGLGAATPAADEREALDRIYGLLAARRLEEAKAEWNRLAPRLQESLRESPATSAADEEARQARAAEALFVQGLILTQAGARDEAMRLLRQADGWGFPPLDSPLMGLAALALAELEEPALSAQAWREVLRRSPEDVPARLGLAASLLAVGRAAEAEPEAREAARRAPGDSEAHALLGAVLLERKRLEEARTHLERALALDPACVACLARLGQVAYLAGDDAACASWLARAVALDPAHPETNLALGVLENRRGHHDLAVVHLSRAVARAPGSMKAQYQLALAYRRSGNAEKAREHQAIYDRLLREQRARDAGVRGAQD
jgi:tetratricopeptide (TPR) repeat protein